MPQLYGMDALNRSNKLYKKSKMKPHVLLQDYLDLFHQKTCSKNVEGQLYQNEGSNIKSLSYIR